ncbi:unnamed protein product [Closterium sp. NIES-53]
MHLQVLRLPSKAPSRPYPGPVSALSRTCPGLDSVPDLPWPRHHPGPAPAPTMSRPYLRPIPYLPLPRPCPRPAPALTLSRPRCCPSRTLLGLDLVLALRAEPRGRVALLCQIALPSRTVLPLSVALLSLLVCCCSTMASPSLLTFDAEGRAVDFDVWLDDLQLFLLCDSKDGLTLFDLTSGASTAPAADTDSTVRSQWLLRDAAARIAVRSHLPSTERTHFVSTRVLRLCTMQGAPPFLFCPLLPLLLLSTLLAPSRSALRLLLVRGAASARASGARELEEVVGAAVVAVEAEEGVGVGAVVEVGASVAAVEVEAAVAVAGGVEEAEAAAAEVELAEAELCSGDPSSSSALVRPLRPSSFMSGVAIFDLDFDAILAAMYAVSISAEGDYYMCIPPDLGNEAAALGASESAAPGTRESATLGAGESALSGTESAQVFHTFTLDSGASRSFFRDRTTLTPLGRPVAVSLADPSRGPVLARYSTVLPCPAAPSGSLSGLYLPSFSTNLVSGADLQDARVDQFILAGAMAALELRWLTYLLTDLGEPPRSPRVLYVDNKAMLALCREHRLEHRTKHIALRYFLARELQQRGQLPLA